jgi:SAM-dependent methyltransferase
MGETGKRRAYRTETGWFDKYLVGKGIDIGCGDDPVTPECRGWDLKDGDAQYMTGVEDETYDWVYSSHCLEHMVDPSIALQNWWRILKPGGHLIVLVPDEDLYEQGHWPPIFNNDHKSTWTIRKRESWSPVSRNLLDELEKLPKSKVVSVQLHAQRYDYTLQGEYRVSLHLPDMKLGELIQEARELRADMLHKYPTPLKLLGFFAIDQTTAPLDAEVSLEGIARKDS